VVRAAQRGTVATPGNYDGVHLGHRALIAAARRIAEPRGLGTVALIFDPHPVRFLAPRRALPLLTTIPRRIEILRKVGSDDVKVLAFDDVLATLAPEEFVASRLIADHRMNAIVIGPDFRFGQARRGDVQTLRRLGQTLGFEVVVVEPVEVGGSRVSSTRVRETLDGGDVATAARLLGRLHDVDGTVVRGDGRGRSMGYPTANLRCDDVVLPSDGVYAVVVRRLDGDGSSVMNGVANLGIRPTFDAGRSVEVHLFDIDRDLVGTRLRVGFVARVREERRFEGAADLKAQIARDAEAAREAIARCEEPLLSWI
jgi:riboflavin kinase/FMN adenylyltransferase